MNRHRAPPDITERTRAFVDAFGVERAARTLGVGRETVLRLAGGLPVRRGSIALVRESLAARDAAAERKDRGL
ncbi:MAG: hypothetical protein IT377_27755 [Polyangiaceae bacterium]|nr:hypothetical protein [Polyangiaceae bacterium]